MPPGIQRSRANAAKDSSLGLKGWDAIQEYMLSHDEDMIRDLADDIDTLLVFAGLFSAVLTAFIIVSIATLQQDNSDVSLKVLSLIALNTGAPDASWSFLNATASSLPASTSFRPTTTSISINALWFTSLVLSLAAALFGMLAKQWCREYLRWHSAITPSQENVLLRQSRYESWQSWGVSSYIASIPAVLEVAVVLFLSGLIVFVWTLERTVAFTVTTVVGTCLLLASSSTVLPAFMQWCPFKSPVGFAFARLVDLVSYRMVPFLLRRAHHDKHSPPPRDWSTRDRLDIRNNHEPTLTTSTSIVRPDARTAEDVSGYATLRATLLIRALSWVRRGSDDVRVLENISESVLSVIHENNLAWVGRDPYGGRLADDSQLRRALCMLCQSAGFDIHRSSLAAFITSLYTAQATAADSEDYLYSFAISQEFSLFFGQASGKEVIIGLSSYTVGAVDAHTPGDSCTVYLVRKILLKLLSSKVQHILCFKGDLNQKNYEWKNVLSVVYLGVAQILAALRYLPPRLNDENICCADARECCTALSTAVRQLELRKDAYTTGIMSMMVRLLDDMCFGWDVHNTEHRSEYYMLVHGPGGEERLPWMLGRQWYPYNFAEHASRLDRIHCEHKQHLCVFAISQSIQAAGRCLELHEVIRTEAIECRSSKPEPLDGPEGEVHRFLKGYWEVIYIMYKYASQSLRHSKNDCGALRALPWIADLVSLYQIARRRGWQISAVPFTSEGNRLNFLLTLALLKDNIKAGLITDVNAAADFENLLDLLDHPDLPANPDHWPLRNAIYHGEWRTPSSSPLADDSEKNSDDSESPLVATTTSEVLPSPAPNIDATTPSNLNVGTQPCAPSSERAPQGTSGHIPLTSLRGVAVPSGSVARTTTIAPGSTPTDDHVAFAAISSAVEAASSVREVGAQAGILSTPGVDLQSPSSQDDEATDPNPSIPSTPTETRPPTVDSEFGRSAPLGHDHHLTVTSSGESTKPADSEQPPPSSSSSSARHSTTQPTRMPVDREVSEYQLLKSEAGKPERPESRSWSSSSSARDAGSLSVISLHDMSVDGLEDATYSSR